MCIWEGSSGTGGCTEPAAGCGEDHYWDYYSCNCKQYPTGYTCSEPSGGCGTGWYWDDDVCSCRSEYDDNTYYSTSYYSPYEHEQNSDRLAYESPERIKCVKGLLTPTEFEKLRFLVPSGDNERDEIQKLGNKVKSCWEHDGVPPGEGGSSVVGYLSPIESEQCLVKSLGEVAYNEINQGKRQPTYDEHIKFEKCFGAVTGDSVNYMTQNQSLPSSVDSCLKNILKGEYESVKNGRSGVPYELRGKVDRCFGVDPQPFEEGRSYKLPEEIKSCLLEAVGVARFNEINSGASEPTEDERAKGGVCFGKLNSDQVNFLPLPPEQVPFLDEDTQLIGLFGVNQETKTIRDRKRGGKIVFRGNGPADSTVNIYIYSDPIVVTTKTDENGDWVYELNQPLSGEKHIAYATVRSGDGRIVRSSVFDFTVVAAEEDLSLALLDESELSDTQNRFIRLAMVFVLVALAVVVFFGLYVYRWNSKQLKSVLPGKDKLPGMGSGRKSERDGTSSSID